MGACFCLAILFLVGGGGGGRVIDREEEEEGIRLMNGCGKYINVARS